MKKSVALQALTLWFVLLIFLQTGPSDPNPFTTTIALVAVSLVFLIPVYLLVEFVGE